MASSMHGTAGATERFLEKVGLGVSLEMKEDTAVWQLCAKDAPGEKKIERQDLVLPAGMFKVEVTRASWHLPPQDRKRLMWEELSIRQ